MPTLINNLPHALKPNTAAPTVGPKTITNVATLLETLSGVTIHDLTDYVVIQVEAASVRMCPEGTAPTTTLGIQILAGQSVMMSRQEAKQSKWIRGTSTDATIQILQYSI